MAKKPFVNSFEFFAKKKAGLRVGILKGAAEAEASPSGDRDPLRANALEN